MGLPTGAVWVLWSSAVICGGDLTEGLPTVSELWTSSGTTYENTDSLAVLRLSCGSTRVFATSKDAHRIELHDAATGRFVRSYGSRGRRTGQFDRPNGIVAVELARATGDEGASKREQFVLVIERNSARVQVLTANGLSPAGVFGGGLLKRPYGGAVSYRGDDTLLYVTDTHVPPDQTVKVFRLELHGSSEDVRLRASHVRCFGEKAGKGMVVEAESIAVDDRLGRVLLCDEASSPKNVKVYTLAGRFTGTTLADGLVKGDPEGIAICDDGRDGFIILTDQQKRVTIWHLFDRKRYAHLGAFTGRPTIANTDGIALCTWPIAKSSRGALFAVDDDAEIKAYPLGDIIDLARRARQRSASPSGKAEVAGQ